MNDLLNGLNGMGNFDLSSLGISDIGDLTKYNITISESDLNGIRSMDDLKRFLEKVEAQVKKA